MKIWHVSQYALDGSVELVSMSRAITNSRALLGAAGAAVSAATVSGAATASVTAADDSTAAASVETEASVAAAVSFLLSEEQAPNKSALAAKTVIAALRERRTERGPNRSDQDFTGEDFGIVRSLVCVRGTLNRIPLGFPVAHSHFISRKCSCPSLRYPLSPLRMTPTAVVCRHSNEAVPG